MLMLLNCFRKTAYIDKKIVQFLVLHISQSLTYNM